MRKRRKSMYLHLLKGQPAYWTGQQICYLNQSRMAWYRLASVLVRDLAEIRKHERDSDKWRLSKGYRPNTGDYGHIRFVMPDSLEELA